MVAHCGHILSHSALYRGRYKSSMLMERQLIGANKSRQLRWLTCLLSCLLSSTVLNKLKCAPMQWTTCLRQRPEDQSLWWLDSLAREWRHGKRKTKANQRDHQKSSPEAFLLAPLDGMHRQWVKWSRESSRQSSTAWHISFPLDDFYFLSQAIAIASVIEERRTTRRRCWRQRLAAASQAKETDQLM